MKIVIIGGVAVGATSAARLRRLDENAEIVLLEKGPYVSFANCGLPYHVGGEIADRDSLLLQSPESLKRRYNLDARVFHEAIGLDPSSRTVRVKDTITGTVYSESYDKLVLGVGARPFIPPVPGINSERVFTVWNVPDVDRIISSLGTVPRRNESATALVVGAGFVGLEMVENLHRLGFSVTLVEKMPRLMPLVDEDISAVIHSTLLRHGVDILTKTGVTAFSSIDDGGIRATFDTGEAIDARLVIWSAGTVPNTEFLRDTGIAMNGRGYIEVNDFLETSMPHIYAGGDSVITMDRSLGIKRPVPLAAPANKQGRIIADNIVRGNTRNYPGGYGTFVLRVMDITVAGTGASTESLDSRAIAHRSVVIHPSSHASYFPGSSTLTVKLIYGNDGAILGAQAAGSEGADKAVDCVSMALQGGLSVFDLAHFDHAYAPPYSSAKSPVNMAGFVAENDLNGLARFALWNDLDRILAEGAFLLDVRSAGEFALGAVPGAVNIPLEELRHRIDEVPRGRKVALYCLSGMRNYVASRVLAGHGFNDIVNMAGGFLMYSYLKAAFPGDFR